MTRKENSHLSKRPARSTLAIGDEAVPDMSCGLMISDRAMFTEKGRTSLLTT